MDLEGKDDRGGEIGSCCEVAPVSARHVEELRSISHKMDKIQSEQQRAMDQRRDNKENFQAEISSDLASFQPPQQQVPPFSGSGGGRPPNGAPRPWRFKELDLTWNFKLNIGGRFVKGGSEACGSGSGPRSGGDAEVAGIERSRNCREEKTKSFLEDDEKLHDTFVILRKNPENDMKANKVNGQGNDINDFGLKKGYFSGATNLSPFSMSSFSQPNKFNYKPIHQSKPLTINIQQLKYHFPNSLTSQTFSPLHEHANGLTFDFGPPFSHSYLKNLTSPPNFKSHSMAASYNLQHLFTILKGVKSLINEALERQWQPSINFKLIRAHLCEGRGHRANYLPP